MDEEEAELRNPFPSPPSHYQNYTTHNLKLLSLLQERVGEDDVSQLEKPRVDWILEEGSYTVFGDTWFVKEDIPSLAEQGGHQLYPADPSVDRRPALHTVLRSLLYTYSRLLDALLLPPPTSSTMDQPEWQKHVEWITIMAQNIMAAANDLRPVQARGSLEIMMKRQLELRQEETKAIHKKCDDLEARIEAIRQASKNEASVSREQKPAAVTQGSRNQQLQATNLSTVSNLDVIRWSEELG